MIALATFNLVPLGIALAIGLATGWWMFRRPAPAAPKPGEPDPK
jgi:hypothetical protein